MKLWLLEWNYKNISPEGNWDVTTEIVVRAPSAYTARKIASEECWSDETKLIEVGEKVFWSNPKYTTCTEIHQDGKIGILLEAFKAG